MKRIKDAIVSANYRDPSSPYKWLVRKKGDPVRKAQACQFVEAKNVTFQRSNKDEQGFGCSIVAHAESVQAGGFESEAEDSTNLRFSFNSFVDETTLREVQTTPQLVLTTGNNPIRAKK